MIGLQVKPNCPHVDECRLVACNGDCELAKPSKPTLADIQQLVLALRQSSFDKGELVERSVDAAEVRAANKLDDDNCAALMAAIAQYGQG